jgi:hypothetical protein
VKSKDRVAFKKQVDAFKKQRSAFQKLEKLEKAAESSKKHKKRIVSSADVSKHVYIFLK